MRVPFPESISYKPLMIYAMIIAGAQLLEGTTFYFTAMVFLFTLIWAAAFNITGGMSFPSGTYIFINGLQTLVLPVFVKVCIGEQGQTHLRAPERIVEAYVGGMIAMLFAAIVSRTLRPKMSLLERVAPLRDLRAAYYGSYIISVCLGLVWTKIATSNADGSFGAALVQADKFPLLMLLMGIAYTVQRTNGRRTVSIPLGLLILQTSLTWGLFTFSKESFLSPLFAWVLMLAVLKVQLRWVHLALFLLMSYATYAFIVPYCNVGRHFDPEGRDPNAVALYLVTHLDDVRAQASGANEGRDEVWSYYGPDMGILDRMNVTGVDSGLVEVTDRAGPIGYGPAVTAFSNFVPHFLWKSKPRGLWGNQYAHEIGVLGADDYATGVSFSPSADAYHEGGFTGIFLVEPLILTLGFVLLDSLVGDARRNLAGLVIIVLLVRSSSEGLLYGSLVACSQPMFGTFITAFFCSYVFPVVSQLIRPSQTIADEPTLQPA